MQQLRATWYHRVQPLMIAKTGDSSVRRLVDLRGYLEYPAGMETMELALTVSDNRKKIFNGLAAYLARVFPVNINTIKIILNCKVLNIVDKRIPVRFRHGTAESVISRRIS